MKKKKEKTIQVGDYEVERRGSRIVVLSPAFVGASGTSHPEEIEVAMGLKVARDVLALKVNFDKREAIQARIDDLYDQMEDLNYSDVVEGFDVEAQEDGIRFGCTLVDSETLAKIKKLLS